jgi:hypothetical protein
VNVNASAPVPAVASKGGQVRSQEKKDNANEVIFLSSSDADKDKDKDADVKDHTPACHVVRTATSLSSDYDSDCDDICFLV